MRCIYAIIFVALFQSFDINAQTQLEIEFAQFITEFDSAKAVDVPITVPDTGSNYFLVYTVGYNLDGDFLIAGDSSIYSREAYSADLTFNHAGCSCFYFIQYFSENYIMIGCDLPTGMVMTKYLFFKRLDD